MRWSLFGGTPPPLYCLIVAPCMVAAIFVSGLYFFRRMEKQFADLV